MHQHRLAGGHVERVARQRNACRCPDREGKQILPNFWKRLLKSQRALGYPLLLAIDSGKSRRLTQIGIKQPRPMTQTTGNVGQRRGLTEPPTPRHQVQKVLVPPKIPLFAKVFAGMRFLSHDARCVSAPKRVKPWILELPWSLAV